MTNWRDETEEQCRVDMILNYHIAAAADELKRLHDAGGVTFRQIQGGLQDVGLHNYLENWLYEVLRSHDDR